jgi:hypothetical protein
MDLKESLIRLSEENEAIGRIIKQVETTAALAQEDLLRYKERSEQEKLVLRECMESGFQEQQEWIIQHNKNRQTALEERLTQRLDAKLELLHTISNGLQTSLDHLESTPSLSQKLKQERKEQIADLMEMVQNQEQILRMRSVRQYQRALRILQANPTARAGKELQEAMETLRSLKG